MIETCQNCKKENIFVLPILAYFANGLPVFRKFCFDCEKERWIKMKEHLMGD